MAAHFEIFRTGDGQYRFVLVADNGEPVAKSEKYTRKEDAERGIEDFIDVASGADLPVEDKTEE